jgi:ABC-2 type transport system permease protein
MLSGAIKNELEKLYHKKRIHVVIGVILFFAILMVSLSYFDKDSESNVDWRTSTEEQVANMEAQLAAFDDKESADYKNFVNQKNKLEFHLENNINPEADGAAAMLTSSVTGVFIKLILPMLIVIITADLISGEAGNGTMKSLLISPIGRKRILLAKSLAALIVSVGGMLISDLLTYLTSIPFYGVGNWNDLIVVGSETFKAIPVWEYMVYGLLLNIVMIVTLISVFILISVLFETVATSISLAISIVVFGGLLGNLQDRLDSLKYFFVLNLDLASHLTGESTLQNSSLLLSSMVMLITVLIALSLAFLKFTKKDMLI